jgi:hypothetical protein
MIFDVFKLAVWLIERYDLQDKVADRFSGEAEAEAIAVEPGHHTLHLKKQFYTPEDILRELEAKKDRCRRKIIHKP